MGTTSRPSLGGFAAPSTTMTLAGVLEALHQQRVTGAVPVVLHLKNGVPQAIDIGTYDRVTLTGSAK